jgi:LysM repeat protein
MPDHRRRRSPFRLLAPLALLLVAGAVAMVVLNSNIADGDDGGEVSTTPETSTERTTTTRSGRPLRRFYRVKPGDSFGAIAEKTNVPIERLEALNPEVDPQALVVGQRIRLRG